jgi:predicted enzyme related to lactoylglutathione lyase
MERSRLSRTAPEIPVSDIKRATDFYQQKLGFRLAVEMLDRAYAIVERDDVAIHLFEDRAQNHSRIGIHIFTEGLDDLYAEFHTRGAQFTQEIALKPWGNRDFRLTDNSGNELKFTESSSHA